MLKKLGRLYADFLKSVRKTGDIKLQQDLQVAKNIEDGLNSQAFIDYINKNFPARTPEERKKAIDILDKIYGTDKPIFAKQREEFMSGFYEVIPEESEESEKVAASFGANVSAPVEVKDTTPISQTVGETTRRRREGQTPVVPTEGPTTGGQTLDTSTYKKFQELGILGNEAATNAYIIDNEGKLSAEEIAFLYAAAGDAPLRPKTDGETTSLVPFPGHFIGVPLSDIIDNYASQGPGGEIEQLQLYLEQNGIVSQNYFAQSRGEPSEELRQVITQVMKWIDMNLYAVEGTGLYDEIMNEMTGSPVFFTKNQEL